MIWLDNNLAMFLKAAAVGQICVSCGNMGLDRFLGWKADLKKMSLLIQQVFYVHKWFISITLIIFGVITFRFADVISSGEFKMARWLAACIGCFWFVRALLQWFYYGWSHWRGQGVRIAIHWLITLIYSSWAGLYLVAAFY